MSDQEYRQRQGDSSPAPSVKYALTREVYELVQSRVLSVKGVSRMSGAESPLNLGIPGIRQKSVKGVKIDEDDGSLAMDIYINVVYGAKIPQVAWDIQDILKNTVKHALKGVEIKEINIHVQGVDNDKPEAEEQE